MQISDISTSSSSSPADSNCQIDVPDTESSPTETATPVESKYPDSRQGAKTKTLIVRAFSLSRGMIIAFCSFAGGAVFAHLGQLAINSQYRPSIPISVLFGLGVGSGSAVSLLLDKREHDSTAVSGIAAAGQVSEVVEIGVEQLSAILSEFQRLQVQEASDYKIRSRDIQRQIGVMSSNAQQLVGSISESTYLLQQLSEMESQQYPQAPAPTSYASGCYAQTVPAESAASRQESNVPNPGF